MTATKSPDFMEDPEMGLLLGTVLVFGLANFWGATLLGWIFKKITPKYMASLSHVATTVAVVSVTTAVFMFVSTRRFIVGPYEQWTFENIGGQVIAGVLVAGAKIWMGKDEEES
ncbi:MAG TPA: hypothetical protein EYQ27_21005 [Gemmatimonadetes bacterium]|nr:hypothetical protein [Gemmatimonadota bacterium]